MRIEVLKGDITEIEADAIVNAANSGLMGGGGVDGAIHRRGGPAILEECMKIKAERGDCPAGEAVHTGAGRLRAKYLIHTVGPIWGSEGGSERALLAACYKNSLSLAESLGCSSIAFPNISTGVYRFPKDLACGIVYKAVNEWISGRPSSRLRSILFVNYDDENYRLYLDRFKDRAAGDPSPA